MKFLSFLAALMCFASESSAQTAPKTLIAFYSYSGNTKQAAQAVQAAVGGDLYEITTAQTYSDKYRTMVQQAKKEIEDGVRPELTSPEIDMSEYEVVFIGSPNWWGTLPTQVSAFLAKYDLSGKKVIPFITHGSGGFQNTVTDMAKQCKGCLMSDKPWEQYGAKSDGIKDWAVSVR